MSYNEDIQQIEYEVSTKFGLRRQGIFVAWEYGAISRGNVSFPSYSMRFTYRDYVEFLKMCVDFESIKDFDTWEDVKIFYAI